MNAARASLVALLLCWAFAAWADVAVPPLTGQVVDQTGTLSGADIAALTQKLKDFEARKGSQIAVLIVPTTAPEAIEQYSIRVAEAWKIGRKKVDDGVFLLVAKDDHKLRIETGYGLEGALTDVAARRIIDEIITPKFRTGDFAGGISAGVDRIISAIDGEPLPAPEPQQSFGGGEGRIDMLFNPLVIFGVLVVGGLLRTLLGRLIGSAATGGVVGLMAWLAIGSLAFSLLAAVLAFVFAMFVGSMASSNGRSGSWSAGGSFSGGGSSGGGGFSGGGGSFGGGGASGSW
ncbi:MAG: YgcG family protein [Bradyrhizobium sp.]|jgi:uncharacterized protein